MSTQTDISYLTFPLESADMATSLASYLTNHGVEANPELNEVTCALTEPGEAAIAYQLRQAWSLFWANSDSELFGLPIFVRPGECDQ